MAIRGSGIQVANASSFTIPWPYGTLAGDLAIISVSNGYAPGTPSGWTALYGPTTPIGISELIAWKVLDSSDIAAGSVVVAIGGTYYGQAEIVTFVGAPAIRETAGYSTGSGQSSASLTTSGAVANGDTAIYFGSARADGANPAVTVNRGSSLQSQGDVSFAGSIYSEAMTGGAVTAVFSFSQPSYAAGAIVIVEAIAGLTPQTITFPAIDSPALAATSTSGLPVTYLVTSGPATISGSSLVITGQGVVTVEATQAGNGTYAAATPVSNTFTVVEFAPHDLTSGTSHWPFVVTASSQTGQAASEAFDGSTGDYWNGTGGGVDWLQLDTASLEILMGYQIFCGAGNAANGPSAWEMQGSNDGLAWTTLDTQSGISGWSYNHGMSFAVSGAGAYRYFRLNVTAVNGGPQVEIDELYLFGKSALGTTAQTITFPSTWPLAATSDSGLAVSYRVTAAPSETGGVISTTVEAYQLGDVTYAAATPVTNTFTFSSQFAPQDMSSDTSHAPFVASASTSSSSAFVAFNGNTGNTWQGAGGGVDWLQLDTGTAFLMVAYEIFCGAGNPANGPSAWQMQGSNDGSTWTTLDTQSGISGWSYNQGKCFILAAPGSTFCRYFRINVTAVNSGSQVQCDLLNLFNSPLLTAQTITFAAIPSHLESDAPFNLAATSDSGLAVTYGVTAGPATVAGNTVTLTGSPGSVTIQATQAGNATYAPAVPVNQTFAVGALTAQTITFPAISNRGANAPPFALLATASSGLPVSYAVVAGTAATISGTSVAMVGVGAVTIQATQNGNGTYSAASPVSVSFNVTPSQRGYICFDQIRAADRTGNGDQLLTYTDPPPSTSTSPGVPGQVSYDTEGNWYWCYGVNQWGRIGPNGYGSAAASPPSW